MTGARLDDTCSKLRPVCEPRAEGRRPTASWLLKRRADETRYASGI